MRIPLILLGIVGVSTSAAGQRAPTAKVGANSKLVADTSRPPLPVLSNLPTDTTFTVEMPGRPRAEVLYFRNLVGIIFDDTTSGTTIRSLLTRYGGRIIGGVPGASEYIIQIPDPGPTFAAADSLVTRLRAVPGVAMARLVSYRTPVYIHSGAPKGSRS